MEGAAEAAPAPSCSSPSGSLSASASAFWPPPQLPAPPSLTDPRWPPVGFLCFLRIPEVTAPPPPEVRPISAAEEANPAVVARGDSLLSQAEGAVPKAGYRWRISAGYLVRGFLGSRALRHLLKSRRMTLGGGLSPTARLAFAVLIEHCSVQKLGSRPLDRAYQIETPQQL